MNYSTTFTFKANFTFESTWIESPTYRPSLLILSLPQDERNIAALLYGIVGTVGLLTCVIMTAIILRNQRLRTRPNILLLDLLISDILFVVTLVPYGIYTTQVNAPQLSTQVAMFCDGFVFFFYALGITNILAVATISVDRYMSVAHPFFYKERINKRYFRLLVAWPWLQSLLSTLPMAFKEGWTWYGGRPELFCSFSWAGADKCYVVFLAATTILAPLLVLCFTNTRVYQIAQKHILTLRRRSSNFTSGFGSMTTDDQFESPSISTPEPKRSPLTFENTNSRNSWPRSIPYTVNKDKINRYKVPIFQPSNSLNSPRRGRAHTDTTLFSKAVLNRCSDSRSPSITVDSGLISSTASTPSTSRRSDVPGSPRDGRIRNAYVYIKERAASIVSVNRLQPKGPFETAVYSKMQVRIVFSTYVLIAVFALCWFPYFIPRILISAGIPISNRLSMYSRLCPIMTAILDPFIILLCRKEIRKESWTYALRIKKLLMSKKGT